MCAVKKVYTIYCYAGKAIGRMLYRFFLGKIKIFHSRKVDLYAGFNLDSH
ncbi:hypothetical protein CHISP_0852 [Chitinispirillum alkaliphilum]|nr:hypothetical protein CHISP_0852 [Chitinispirillum alkaliphilum]